MLRPRAKKLPPITEEMWLKVNEEYRYLVEEFLSVQDFSAHTKKQYTSALRQFGWFVYERLGNKPLYKITKREFSRFLGYLRNERQMSSSSVNFRKAAVSTLNNFIENIIADEEENYKNFRNFTRGMPTTSRNKVYEKKLVTFDEFKMMLEALEEEKDYLGVAWLATAYIVGARRAEIKQFKTEMLNYEVNEDNYFNSHYVRGKGQGSDGKQLRFIISGEVLPYWQKWVEHRGYEHEYIFTTKHNGEIKVISDTWANYFCQNKLSKIAGRRITPHIFKASCITYHLERGVPIEFVSKHIAMHESVETTIQHYDLRSFEDKLGEVYKGAFKL